MSIFSEKSTLPIKLHEDLIQGMKPSAVAQHLTAQSTEKCAWQVQSEKFYSPIKCTSVTHGPQPRSWHKLSGFLQGSELHSPYRVTARLIQIWSDWHHSKSNRSSLEHQDYCLYLQNWSLQGYHHTNSNTVHVLAPWNWNIWMSNEFFGAPSLA